MAVKAFLDANVILDLFLQRDDFANSEMIVELIINGHVKGYVTSSVVHIVGYWTTKYLNSSTAKEMLLRLLTDVTVIDIHHEVVLQALHSAVDDIEDGLQYYTALYHNLDYFITRDKVLLKQGIPSLPIISPGDFLEIIS
ncbi:MAG: PIN domain-containing protein [Bacteroidota bacterium]